MGGFMQINPLREEQSLLLPHLTPRPQEGDAPPLRLLVDRSLVAPRRGTRSRAEDFSRSDGPRQRCESGRYLDEALPQGSGSKTSQSEESVCNLIELFSHYGFI
ncbi:hypothetical protein CDAR_615761 [Caerostris darwini]|uniref:Uncharacterized protein n=1 Tax=Caerostris darwini TaxID=1538125 RepID=A0AAV4RUC6_9ARAC|nr:hypothetical protein CDAR_615761 [Caerostris darwini]